VAQVEQKSQTEFIPYSGEFKPLYLFRLIVQYADYSTIKNSQKIYDSFDLQYDLTHQQHS